MNYARNLRFGHAQSCGLECLHIGVTVTVKGQRGLDQTWRRPLSDVRPPTKISRGACTRRQTKL